MNLDRAKTRVKQLLERVKQGLGGGTESELDNAKSLLKFIMNKYGWKEEDFADFQETKSKISNVVFTPEISDKKNPQWFRILCNLLSVHQESQTVVFTDKLGCLLRGESDKVENFRKDLEFAIGRSKQTYQLICAFVSGKKPNKADYMLGFAFGFDAAIIEDKAKQAEANQTDEETNKALMIVSFTLAKLKSETEEMKSEGKVKETLDKTTIKDQDAYLAGFVDGKLCRAKLLESK